MQTWKSNGVVSRKQNGEYYLDWSWEVTWKLGTNHNKGCNMFVEVGRKKRKEWIERGYD